MTGAANGAGGDLTLAFDGEVARYGSQDFVPLGPSKPGKGGLRKRLTGWFGGDAGTPIDGWLTTVCSQIGQIMLTLPNAYSKVGLPAALPLSLGCACMSLWTMFCLISLYVERKARLIREGKWDGDEGKAKHVTQASLAGGAWAALPHHDVMGDNLGPWARTVVQVVVAVALFGTNVSQIVASSSDAYYLGGSWSKRDLAILFGALAQISVFLPTLRHFRIINIVGIIGTTYTTWYIVGQAAIHHPSKDWARGPPSIRDFYNGFSVIMSAFGGHAMALEIMDSMFVPEGYTNVYLWSFFYIFSLTLPHSVAVQVTWPDQAIKNGNVYGVLPLNDAKKASIYLMLIHQIIAFCLYSAPLYYMSEKILRVHTKRLWWRIPARIPISAGVAVFAVAFPFYGTINAMIGALTSPLIAFAFPAAAFSWVFRTKEAQQRALMPPPKWLLHTVGWGGIHAFNAFIILFFLVNGTGFGMVNAVRQFAHDVNSFRAFPHCFQCDPVPLY
ncbi:hypothetical protein Rsub_00192 [Raphidocelis subcapitata]|uniref:Amino acid transporter transmembrane domain-containing protein n=1 Tax=Raphidocelis subcapitata TaxID=307507 RepID=A0A2V0NJR6_9CHLO|nr:hypothetical protein Rsub_00192 [Raphidocelis subcapitata]|eukprot:GBF87481.1 hypothetical protein Rsub_00192 [Raphidocelis subcapitata]